MDMKKIFPLFVAIVAGCAGPKPIDVKVDSDPAGAHIFWSVGANEDFASQKNRQYLGTTPFVWTVHPKGDGSFDLPGALIYSTFVPPVGVVTAEPPASATNLFIQRQVFHSGTIATASDKVPQAIFFDMHKPSVGK